MADKKSNRVIPRTVRDFEEEIQAYTGRDPIEVWNRYLTWYKDKNGTSEEYADLLTRCINAVKHYERYSNDLRLVEIWIQYAKLSAQSIETYTFMYDKDIGNKQAKLYITWALELCEMEQNQEAIKVLKKGISAEAQPLNDIKCFLMELDPTFKDRPDTSKNSDYQQNSMQALETTFFNKNNFDFPVAYFEPYNPKVTPMYPKDKIYAGGNEYSMEELKAFKLELEHWKLQQKLKLRAKKGNALGSTETLLSGNYAPQNIASLQSLLGESKSKPDYFAICDNKENSPEASCESNLLAESMSPNRKKAIQLMEQLWGEETSSESWNVTKKEQSLYLEPQSTINIEQIRSNLTANFSNISHDEKENLYAYGAETTFDNNSSFLKYKVEEPPTNTNIFITNAKVASTPFISSLISYKRDPNLDEPTIKALGIKEKKKPLFESNKGVDIEVGELQEQTISPHPSSMPNLVEKELKEPVEPQIKNSLSSESHSSTNSRSSSKGEDCLKNRILQFAQESGSMEEETEPFILNENEVLLCTLNPFDDVLLEAIMEDYRDSLFNNSNSYQLNKKLPVIKSGEVKLEDSTFIVFSRGWKGAFGTVFPAVKKSEISINSPTLALKVSRQTSPWEYYICNELQKRLNPVMLPAVIKINEYYSYSNGQVLVSDFHKWGTLLDLVNLINSHDMKFQETVIIYFAHEIFSILEELQKHNIIHADIKPSNVLINEFPDKKHHPEMIFQSKCLKLIDFGRAIDLNLFPTGTAFINYGNIENFKCPEMLDNKPWSFHQDIYGALSIIHLLLFNEYISLQKVNGKYEIQKKFKRYWQVSIWEPLFNDLLNIPELPELPSLRKHILQLGNYLERKAQSFFSEYETLKNLLKCSKPLSIKN